MHFDLSVFKQVEVEVIKDSKKRLNFMHFDFLYKNPNETVKINTTSLEHSFKLV
jgi:hypothetical protein